MERAGGSYNTLQIIAHPRSPLYSPPPIPPTYLSFSFLPFHLSHIFPLSLTFVNNPFPRFFLFILPLRDDGESPRSPLTADGGASLQEVSVI